MSERNHIFHLFHLNMAFSAIPESERSEVIQRCYDPLLDLPRQTGCPITIEATGWTLEVIERLSPQWIERLGTLIEDGLCEFVGSGYVQAIGPLMPEKANVANQRIGLDTYRRMLGISPKVALVNEQAYSAGLVPIYKDAGYQAIVLDWANVYSRQSHLDPKCAHFPQLALGPDDEEMAVIWCDAIAFQKFQRYAHGELEADELEAFLADRLSGVSGGCLASYASDAEIFDFRPGRYTYESKITQQQEWHRIAAYFERLSQRDDIVLATASVALATKPRPEAWNRMKLETPASPVLVKKQPKYNITRWAVTGRDDLALNTACWRLFRKLDENPETTDADWRELLELWSSDFRTHIDDGRWRQVTEQVSSLARTDKSPPPPPEISLPSEFSVSNDGRIMTFSGPGNVVSLNLQRGLAIKSMATKPDEPWWVGTIAHGYFSDISWSADFFSGHLVCQIPGHSQITDLAPVEPDVAFTSEPEPTAVVSATIGTSLGDVHKRLRISANRPRIEIEYAFGWQEPILGSVRMAHITLNPEIFSANPVAYECHNGGHSPERFEFDNLEFDLGAPISTLITCTSGLGLTDGRLEIGDAQRRIRLSFDPAEAAMIGLLTAKRVDGKRFLRASLTAREHDDTSQGKTPSPLPIRPLSYRFSMELIRD